MTGILVNMTFIPFGEKINTWHYSIQVHSILKCVRKDYIYILYMTYIIYVSVIYIHIFISISFIQKTTGVYFEDYDHQLPLCIYRFNGLGSVASPYNNGLRDGPGSESMGTTRACEAHGAAMAIGNSTSGSGGSVWERCLLGGKACVKLIIWRIVNRWVTDG